VASLALPWFAPPEILSLKVATFKGGRSNEFLREFYPALYNSQQRRMVDNARRSTEEKIAALQSGTL